MHEHSPTATYRVLYKLTCLGEVDEQILVLRVFHGYCQVAFAGRSVIGADRENVGYADGQAVLF